MLGLVGPIFSDLDRLNFSGERVVIATAFYSRSALFNVKVSADRLDLMVRLDLNSCEEWKRGMIDPIGLSSYMKNHIDAGIDVRLLVHPIAHAKAYIGRSGFLVGSANLTVRGFSGVGHELLWLQQGKASRDRMIDTIDSYAGRFKSLSHAHLGQYVAHHLPTVNAWRKGNPLKFQRSNQDRIEGGGSKAAAFGDYDAFKVWLDRQPEAEAATILRRANGEGGLSGHIRANFFGLRQWMLFDQAMLQLARTKSADTYNLAKGSIEETRLKSFVDNNAADEPGFSLATWRRYLPIECGGNVGKRGGTIGNLHRMIPLIAKYLP